MNHPASPPLVVRNSRVVLAIYLLFAGVAFVAAAGSAILGLASLFPFAPRKIVSALFAFVGALVLANLGMTMWRWTVRMAGNSVRFAPDGLWFSLAPTAKVKTPAPEAHFAWHRISAVTQQRRGNLMIYSLVGTDGVVFTFTPLTFVRAGHVARLIAARAGISLAKAG